MDTSLFAKYSTQIKNNQQEKKDLLTHIQTTIGISLQENEITIKEKNVSFNVSSVLRNILVQKNIQNILIEKGYTNKI